LSTNPIVVTYGSCIDLDLNYTDEAGEAEDISGDSFSVFEASSDAFDGVVFTKTDPENGLLHLYLDPDDAKKLKLGRVNSFRVRRLLPDGCEDNTPPILVQVI